MDRNYTDVPGIQIRLPWDRNAAIGYSIATGVVLVTLFMMTCVNPKDPHVHELPTTIPITLLSFGEGDGSGARKGNLTAEGKALRGQKPANDLADASKPSTSNLTNRAVADPNQASHLRPVDAVGVRGQNTQQGDAGEMMLGSRDGSDDGTGLGGEGTGSGKGLGYGDIDWGGGGNRLVVSKVLPKYPPGTLNTKVRLRFRVLPDGTVSDVWPVQRSGNPVVDREAMIALRRWRFNKLLDQTEMEGVITFVFRTG